MHDVAKMLLRALALGIGIEDEEFFLRCHSGNNNQLRLLHYPPVPAAELESQLASRMPAHSDWGTLTMLFQDDCGGLEVRTLSLRYLPPSPSDFMPHRSRILTKKEISYPRTPSKTQS